jgi:transcription initiation factor IIE alpha subunit
MGNPTAYQIVRYLVKRKRATPTDLVHRIDLSLQTICDTLRNLRNIDVVRYDTINRDKVYVLKDTKIVVILDDIEGFVRRARFKAW